MHLDHALGALATLEFQLAELYGIYAKIFHDDEEARALFTKLRRDELAHKNLVDLQIRLAAKSSEGSAEVNMDADAIRETSERIEQHIKDGIFTIEDAVKFSVDIERSSLERHSNQAFKDTLPELALLIESLAKGDEAHLKSILEFSDKLLLKE